MASIQWRYCTQSVIGGEMTHLRKVLHKMGTHFCHVWYMYKLANSRIYDTFDKYHISRINRKLKPNRSEIFDYCD